MLAIAAMDGHGVDGVMVHDPMVMTGRRSHRTKIRKNKCIAAGFSLIYFNFRGDSSDPSFRFFSSCIPFDPTHRSSSSTMRTYGTVSLRYRYRLAQAQYRTVSMGQLETSLAVRSSGNHSLYGCLVKVLSNLAGG
jgi:hypothetical protein